MVQKEKTKIGAFIIVSLVIGLSFFHVEDWGKIAIYADCDFHNRLIYPFFHANIMHLFFNVWCLLSVVFFYNITPINLLAMYLFSVSVPVDTLSLLFPSMYNPTVGLSGMVFALCGFISFQVQRRWYYQSWMLFYIILGFLVPHTNGVIHLYCYILGLFSAVLSKPFKKEAHGFR